MKPLVPDGQEGPGIDLGADGPAVTFLALVEGQEGKRWRKRTKWVHADQNVAYIHIATSYIRSLWHIAAYRYAQAEFDPTKLQMFTGKMASEVQELANRQGKSIVIPSMEMDLHYYSPPEARSSPA
jgi:hypothetical protein